MAIRITPTAEGTPVAKSLRELLDDAAACEGSDIEAARSMAQQARVLAHTLDDQVGEAESLYRLASIAYRSGQADTAFSVALDARDLASRAGSPAIEARATMMLGLIHYDAGNYSDALDAALQSLEVHRLSGVPGGEGPPLNTIAIIHHSLGDTDRALVTYEAALTANRSEGRREHEMVTLANMAEVRAQRNEHLLAVSLGESALELARVHYSDWVPRVLAQLATSYCALGAFDQAEACLTEAERSTFDETDRAAAATSRCTLALARGQLQQSAGRLEAAVSQVRRALHIASEESLLELELRCHTQLAELYKTLGQFDHALTHQEARFEKHSVLFSRGTDLRIKTLQIAHDTEAARQQAEILRLRTGELEEMVRGRTYDLEEYQLEAFQRLAVIAEFRDTDTGEHTIRVGDLAREIATELGEGTEFADRLRLAGRLHDIGKVAVPDAILLKAGPLTSAEFEVMKTHTTVGAEILSGSSSPLIQLAAEVALNHHERWDGTGYPNGLIGTSIPLSGRIVAVADVYDALRSERPYKRAWSMLEAIRYIIASSELHFEPRIVDAFLQIMLRAHPEIAVDLADDLAERSQLRSTSATAQQLGLTRQVGLPRQVGSPTPNDEADATRPMPRVEKLGLFSQLDDPDR